MEVAPGAGEEQLPPGKVTRTNLPDITASVAQVKIVLSVFKGSPILVKDCDSKRDECCFAISRQEAGTSRS